MGYRIFPPAHYRVVLIVVLILLPYLAGLCPVMAQDISGQCVSVDEARRINPSLIHKSDAELIALGFCGSSGTTARCPSGYGYYYDGKCQRCKPGSVFDSANYVCCNEDRYYDGQCHYCSRGRVYTSGANVCCPEDYPYYYRDTCNKCREGELESGDMCCPEESPHAVNGQCSPCTESEVYDQQSGTCCPGNYPYQYNNQCNRYPEGYNGSETAGPADQENGIFPFSILNSFIGWLTTIGSPSPGSPTVNPSNPVRFTSQVFPVPYRGVNYSYSFCKPNLVRPSDLCGAYASNPTGGNPPYHFVIDPGGFPPMGLVLYPNGMLIGKPSAPGTYHFRVCAVDLSENQACIPVDMTVENPFTKG